MKNRTDDKKVFQPPLASDTHLSDYLEILIRRKWMILILFVVIVAGVTTASLLATPQYKAAAQLLLTGQPTPMNPLGETPRRVPEINLYHQTQVNLLKSRSLARTVIDELGLRERFTQDASATPTPTDPAPTEAEADGAIINRYLKNLEILPVRNSSLVNVTFTGSNAELITRIVNKHAKAAIQNAIQDRKQQAMNALDWLKSQISRQKKEVENAQRAIYDFKKQHNALSLEDNQIIYSQELQELNSALTRAKSDRIAKQATYLQLQEILTKRQDILQMSELSEDPVIQNLRNQLVSLMSQKIEWGTKFGPKHPKMIELDSGINQLNQEIMKEKQRLMKAMKSDLDRAVAVEGTIVKSLARQKEIAMSLGEQAIEHDVLKQQAESSQEIYDFLLKQSKEVSLSSAIKSSNMHVVDYAEVPTVPVSPNLKLNILLAVFLSLFAGVGLSLFLEYLDNSVKTPMDVALRLGLPVLGMIPFHKAFKGKNGNNPLIEPPTNGNRESLPPTIYHISNRLPDALRSRSEGLFGRVLIVESVTMDEGKSTVIAQMASNLTEAGLRVLLVDCDFQRPSLDRILATSNGGGLGIAIDHIMSRNLTSGTLSEYSMDDLFFLVGLKKRSGRLIVENDEQTMVAFFQNGVLVHIQNKKTMERNRIGTMLLNGGFITVTQLNDALQRHQRTGQPLGYILVNAGYLGREKLRGPLRLQIEEYLQKMFSWKRGRFVFKPGMVHLYENERIFFEEDYSPMINSLGRIERSKFIEKELFSHLLNLRKENLYLLPAGSSYKLIGSLNHALMNKVFEKLKQHFDVLLVDTPPLDAASGIESIFPLADGIVVVVKAGHLSVKVLSGALNHLPQDKIIGTVLNQVKSKVHPTYY
jgi:uncharacterized protein involved in exopolysaccharide biosynthesis/Mrp family chromosome partitioning ATPase